MIDIHAALVAILDANLTGGETAAIRVTTEVLADCWDDCAAALPPKMREADAPNPYRLALDLTPDGPHAPRIAFVDDPPPEGHTRYQFVTTVDDNELAAMQLIVKVLDGLDKRTQNRVITYISERIA